MLREFLSGLVRCFCKLFCCISPQLGQAMDERRMVFGGGGAVLPSAAFCDPAPELQRYRSLDYRRFCLLPHFGYLSTGHRNTYDDPYTILQCRADALGPGVLVALVCRNQSAWEWLASRRRHLHSIHNAGSWGRHPDHPPTRRLDEHRRRLLASGIVLFANAFLALPLV